MDDEIGYFAQAFCTFGPFGTRFKGPQSLVCGEPFFFGHLSRSLQAIYGRKGDLVLLRVLAGGFAERLRELADFIVHRRA